MKNVDTIVAIATPPGRGGLGVVRLSGERALEIATGLVHFPRLPLETQRATLGALVDPEAKRMLDEVVVTWFCEPHSYTGEDVVEISCHGAPVLLRYLVECSLDRGARAAEPGEFTLRAFLNGRIDLTQAEAVRDLIEARTLYQARVAAQQMEGAVSARLKPHKQVLLDLIARLEAGIDFAEDDVPVMDWPDIAARLDAILADLRKLVEGYKYGRIVREGLGLAIVGRPNVGKSSLFNRLLNEERAIVTPTPGTTRDMVSETANVGGIPLRLMDTAGIRPTRDDIEKMGVEKSFQAIADSDLRLLLVDAAEGWTSEDADLLRKLLPLGAVVVACNKMDLPSRLSVAELQAALSQSDASGTTTAADSDARDSELQPSSEPAGEAPVEVIWTSALTGQGLHELREKILEVAAPARDSGPEGQFITNLRHQQLIKESLAALTRARQAAAHQIPHEMLLLDLYDALRPLDQITGATYIDDLLNIIFSTFCVGK
jgi:tRNA modification GTPase